MKIVDLPDSKAVAEALFYVLDKNQRVVPFKHRPVQELLWKARSKGRRHLVCKARQQGVSTGIEYWFLADAITTIGTHAVVISHDQSETIELLERVHFALNTIQNSPQLIPRHFDSRSELSFPLAHGTLKVKPAGAKVTGRGPTINRLHGSEVAFWDNPVKVLGAILQTVPADGWVYLESTGNGAGGMFYELCMASMRGENEWVFTFFPWTLSPEYACQLDPGEEIILNEEERQIEPEMWVGGERIILSAPTPEQMKWRRKKINELHSVEAFKQEYYQLRGWDKRGVPTKKKLEELRLA